MLLAKDLQELFHETLNPKWDLEPYRFWGTTLASAPVQLASSVRSPNCSDFYSAPLI